MKLPDVKLPDVKLLAGNCSREAVGVKVVAGSRSPQALAEPVAPSTGGASGTQHWRSQWHPKKRH